MTAMQKDAVALIQEMPEEQIAALLVIMRAMSHEAQSKRGDLAARRKAYERLESLTRTIPGIDEKKELANWREEKFGYAGAD